MKLTLDKFSRQNNVFSAFAESNLFLSLVMMSPAVENKRSTSVVVGGGVRYISACSASFFSLRFVDF